MTNTDNDAKIVVENFSDALCRRRVIFLKRVCSTNIVARNLARKGRNAAVIAAEQYGGMGSHGRRWESDIHGGLYMSLATCAVGGDISVRYSSIAAAVAVRRAVQHAAGIAATVKWPNDLLLNGGKLCGILSEAFWGKDGAEYLITGIGLNVNQRRGDFPPELREAATSLLIECGEEFGIKALAYDIIKSVDEIFRELEERGTAGLIEEYSANCCTLGKRISVSDCGKEVFRGMAEGLGADGSLIVRDADGNVEEFNFGEVTNREIQ